MVRVVDVLPLGFRSVTTLSSIGTPRLDLNSSVGTRYSVILQSIAATIYIIRSAQVW